MRKSTTISLASILLVFLLTACGSTLQPANLDRATATAFQSMAVQASQLQLSTLQEPISFVVASVETAGGSQVPAPLTALLTTAGVEPQAPAACVTETVVGSDADGDSIPTHGSYVYDCNETDDVSGITTRISGTVDVSDEDDSDEFSGYTLDMSNLNFSMTSGGETFSFTIDLLVDLAEEPNGTYEGTFDLLFSMSGPDLAASISYEFDQTYVADAAVVDADPFSKGALDFSGNLSLRSDGYIYSLDASGSHTVDDTCTYGLSDGTSSYSDNAGNSLTIDFTCADATAYFNSTTLASY